MEKANRLMPMLVAFAVKAALGVVSTIEFVVRQFDPAPEAEVVQPVGKAGTVTE